MSWSQWPGAPALPGVVAAPPVQSAILPAAVNPAQMVAPPANAGMQYSPEQWAQLQQQNWQQWAQWQQQYQQWHQQYGAEYHKSMNALTTASAAPAVMETNTSIPPPPPNESKPPPPPPPDDGVRAAVATPGYMTAPPPIQQYNTNNAQNSNMNQWSNMAKRPYIQSQEYESGKRQMIDTQGQWIKNTPPPNIATSQSQKVAINLEELTEAEKKFDKEFAAWEAQFNKWKEQNASHPDKTQFMEYEKKWESWRNSLLDRREQMRKKRLALTATLPPKPAPVVPQLFNEPPPTTGHMFSNQPPQLPPTDIFSKPPPTQNNEPLAFKANKGFPGDQPPESDGGGSDFLKSASPTPGGIPGLDLVKEGGDAAVDENKPDPPKGPDFDAISKGINNILGDSKLMNMLSMVSQKKYTSETQYEPNQRETVNNFDDQTQTSFSNGREQNYTTNYDRFREEPLRNSYDSNLNDNRRNQYGRYSNNDDNSNKFQNDMGPDRMGGYNQHKRSDYEHPYGEEPAYDDQNQDGGWNEEDDYDKYHNMFDEDNHNVDNSMNNASVHSEPMPVEDEPLFVPELVIDYEHKALKEPEPEVSLEVTHMFDYRHKNINRLPYPQRPTWLSNTCKGIRQFNPLGAPRRTALYDRDFNYRDREPQRPDFNKDYGNERYRDNDKDKFFPGRQNRDADFGRRPDRFDGSPRNSRDSRWGNNDRSAPRGNRNDRNQREHKPLDLEELSDEEWSDDNAKQHNADRSKSNTEAPVANPTVASVSAQILLLEDLINIPGRFSRPQKIVIILRGPPGSGKTYLAKLIKDREVENGGSAPRILSLDDYFMVEQEKEVVEEGKRRKIKEMIYEYEAAMEETYRQSLIKSFKKTVTDGYFNFIVVDNVNQKVKNFGEMWSFAKQNGFQVYICELDLDPQLCTRRNVHNRSQRDIEDCIAGWEPTPVHHPKVDATDFLQSCGPITEVEMEEVDQNNDEEHGEAEDHNRSKWDSFDCSLNNLARLDGVNKPLRSSKSMEEYLQLDEWKEPSAPLKPGQKRVRWADLEEQKQQKKMKALGFVVGHTDWDRMMDPTNGESALIQTKYIERVRRY